MAALLIALAAVTGSAPEPPQEVGFEILVAGGSPSGFRIDENERYVTFDGNPHRTGPEPPASIADRGTFAFAVRQLDRYRRHADDGCVAKPTDVIAFRITWRVGDAVQAATFADSCHGVPTDLIDTLRPIGERLERQADRAPTGPMRGEP